MKKFLFILIFLTGCIAVIDGDTCNSSTSSGSGGAGGYNVGGGGQDGGAD